MEQSISGQLNKQEKNKWIENTTKYGVLALIVFLTAIQNGVAWQQALYLVYLWGLNVALDLLTKYSQGTDGKM